MTDPQALSRLFGDIDFEQLESRFPVRGVIADHNGSTAHVHIPSFDGGVEKFPVEFSSNPPLDTGALVLCCRDEADTYWIIGIQGIFESVPGTTATGSTGAGKTASSGGWVKVGATWDTWWQYGYDEPTFASHMACGSSYYNNGMSFAELLVAGANANLSGESLQAILGTPVGSHGGMPCGTKLQVRMPGGSQMFTIEKADVGSGQAGDAHYKIDLHPEVAWALLGDSSQSHTAWGNQDIEVKLA